MESDDFEMTLMAGPDQDISIVLDKRRPFIVTIPVSDEPDRLGILTGFMSEDGRPMMKYSSVRRADWPRLVAESNLTACVVDYGFGHFLIQPAAADLDILCLSADIDEQCSLDRATEANFPRIWELLRFVLGRRLREQVFEPAYNDLLADHLTTRAARFQTPCARQWIKFCFVARTSWLIVECAVIGLRGASAAILVPAALRAWIREWWFKA